MNRCLSDDRHGLISDVKQVLFAMLLGALFFGSLWACAADAGVDAPVLDVHHATVTLQDGGVVEVAGGGWLRDDVLISQAQRLVVAESELARLQAAPPAASSTPALVLTNVLTGIVQTIGAAMTACWAATGNAICLKK